MGRGYVKVSKKSNLLTKQLKKTPVEQVDQIRRDLQSERDKQFDRFALQLNSCRYLGAVEVNQRKALLRELHRLAKYKSSLELQSKTDQKESSQFRKYRESETKVARLVSQGRKRIEEAAEIYPNDDVIAAIISGQDDRLTLLILADLLRWVEDRLLKDLPTLSALVHPELRTGVERTLVKWELVRHSQVPHSEKTRVVDHWFIGAAAATLEKYRTQNGNKIGGYDKIIAKLFRVYFADQTRSEESIRKELSRRRRGQ